MLASLWVDVDVAVPYTAGELLARVRERGTVEIEYGERDVRIQGRVAPALAGELEAVAAALGGSDDGRDGHRSARPPADDLGSARRARDGPDRRPPHLESRRGRARDAVARDGIAGWRPDPQRSCSR